jgi:LPS-assembly protein
MKFHISGDAQSLTREQGVDQTRISVTPGASLPFVTDGGHIFTTTLNLRQDFYQSNDVAIAGSGNFTGSTTRTLPQAAQEWRLPMMNQFKDAAWIVEPMVLAVAQTSGGNPAKISNEDSQLIELSDTNLFSLNRAPGLDLYDSGSRLAYGLRTHYYHVSSVSLEGLFGQNYAFDSNTPYPNSARPGEHFSDYIGRAAITYMPVTLSYRFAVDKEDATLNRNDVGVGLNVPWLGLNASYRTLKNNRYLPDSREAIVSASLPFSDSWSIYGAGRRDLELNQMVSANGGIIYKNECFNIVLDSARSYARDRDIAPITEFTFRVAFKNLGEFGGK